MTPTAEHRERIHHFWDRLADFDAAQVDQALDFLMASLCELLGADNAEWIGLVRLADEGNDDPAHGWRPPVVRLLHANDSLTAAIREQAQTLGKELRNPAALNILDNQGSFRAIRLCDVATPDWFESDVYRTYYRDCGRDDAVYVTFPVNRDAESCFGFFLAGTERRFTTSERDTLAYALRGIKWFHRQLLLSHGQLVASAPLTQVERSVLQGLLSGLAEKAIAAQLGHSPNTTHGHVSAIYRKFGVNNRPALIALWLGTKA